MGVNKKLVSATNGKTLWEMFTERIASMFGTPDKPIEKPVELQYYSPLEAKIGQTIQIEAEAGLEGIDFVIESIEVYETLIGGKKFYHADYVLRGISLTEEKPILLRLRLIDDDQATNPLRCKLELLHVFQEQEYVEDLYNLCMKNGDHDDTDEPGETTFKVNYTEDGTELETPQRFWRCEGVPNPYRAKVISLKKTGMAAGRLVDAGCLVDYWDFSRITNDDGDQDVTECLTVEMDMTLDQGRPSRYMTILRGPELKSFQVHVT